MELMCQLAPGHVRIVVVGVPAVVNVVSCRIPLDSGGGKVGRQAGSCQAARGASAKTQRGTRSTVRTRAGAGWLVSAATEGWRKRWSGAGPQRFLVRGQEAAGALQCSVASVVGDDASKRASVWRVWTQACWRKGPGCGDKIWAVVPGRKSAVAARNGGPGASFPQGRRVASDSAFAGTWSGVPFGDSVCVGHTTKLEGALLQLESQAMMCVACGRSRAGPW